MEIIPELLRKYHQGLCTPTEQAAVRQWLEKPPNSKRTTTRPPKMGRPPVLNDGRG